VHEHTIPIADVRQMGQHHRMFDWSDLHFLLPTKVQSVLIGLLCEIIACILIWADV